MSKWIPGVNCEIASKEQYQQFIHLLAQKLNSEFVQSSFQYGSNARETPIPGKSDVDAVVVMNQDELLTNWGEVYNHVSRAILDSHEETTNSHALERPIVIPLQFSFTDSRIAQDGRLVTYTSDFRRQFQNEAKVICGAEFGDWLKTRNYKLPLDARLGFNLAKMRQKRIFRGSIFSDELSDVNSAYGNVNNYLRGLSEIGNIFSVNHETQRAANLEVVLELGAPVDIDLVGKLRTISSGTNNWVNFAQSVEREEVSDLCLQEMEKLSWWYVDLPTEEREVRIRVPKGVKIEY